jgi:hypothetical protein
MKEITIGYHGSVIDRPLIPTEEYFKNNVVFDKISSSMNELNAFFVSGNQDVCEFFSDIKLSDPENQIQSILKAEIKFDKIYIQEFKFNQLVEYKGIKYNYKSNIERTSLYAELKKDGYQGFIMKNDYDFDDGVSGDDIAIFDDGCVECTEAKLKIGDSWTNFMPIEEAREYFVKWALNDLIDNEDSQEYTTSQDQYCHHERDHDRQYDQEYSF